jgi:hypothetical protein
MLSGELLGVIDQTMEPTTVWLWLQPRAGPSYPQSDAHRLTIVTVTITPSLTPGSVP